jgi:hypothetical protein
MFLFIILFSSAIASIGPSSFPVFLKEGFSSILEFEEAPTQVVLGDQNLFQVERLNKSIIIKPLSSYATTNMFIYFKTKQPRLILLRASEEAEPTFYKKFESVVPKLPEKPKVIMPTKYPRGLHLKSKNVDAKKDYVTLDIVIASNSSGKVIPNWDLIRMKHKDSEIRPTKLWSERREVQRDSFLKVRLIFIKPNVPENFKDVSLIVPIKDEKKPWNLSLHRGNQ